MHLWALLSLGTGNQIEQLGRDLCLPTLAGVLVQLLQLFRDIVVGGLHGGETRRVLARQRLDRRLGQKRRGSR